MIGVPFGEQLAAQVDHIGVIHVEPLDSSRRIDSENTAVHAAAHVEHGRIRVICQIAVREQIKGRGSRGDDGTSDLAPHAPRAHSLVVLARCRNRYAASLLLPRDRARWDSSIGSGVARPFKVMSIVSFSLVKWIFSVVIGCSLFICFSKLCLRLFDFPAHYRFPCFEVRPRFRREQALAKLGHRLLHAKLFRKQWVRFFDPSIDPWPKMFRKALRLPRSFLCDCRFDIGRT